MNKAGSMKSIFEILDNIYPQSITILPTYRCNAACEQCCFESNPRIKGRLEKEDILNSINRINSDFPSVKLIVFSGGECTLLKDDLYDSIKLASSLGFSTRIVTNAGWGKTRRTAAAVVEHLSASGLNEINISTGLDHQKWVPFASVCNAAEAALGSGIPTLVTIEKDSPESYCLEKALTSEVVQSLLKEYPSAFHLLSNSWMPFNDRMVDRSDQAATVSTSGGCSQLFQNMVITPDGGISACCGLTFEYIPELKIGRIDSGLSLKEIYEAGLNDFLKIWIHLDGPKKIIEMVMGGGQHKDISESHVHICQTCVFLYQDNDIREAIKARYLEFFPDVMRRFVASRELQNVKADSRRVP